MSTKLCLKCNTQKSLEEMVKRNDRVNGYRSLCKECKSEDNKGWIKYNHQYFQDHKDKIREKRKAYRHGNVNTRLAIGLRSRLYQAMKNDFKVGSAVGDLGCSIEELRQRLESRFTVGMSWANYGQGKNKWNIDHIVALANFDLSDREQFLKACHYTNLQPLWQPDNLKKGAR